MKVSRSQPRIQTRIKIDNFTSSVADHSSKNTVLFKKPKAIDKHEHTNRALKKIETTLSGRRKDEAGPDEEDDDEEADHMSSLLFGGSTLNRRFTMAHSSGRKKTVGT